MWKATIRGFVAHKFRLALTVLAVVLGVGFVAGTYVLTDTMDRTFDDLFAEVTGRIDVVVRSEAEFVGQTDERDPVPEELLDTVLAVDGVAVAEGGVDGYAQLVDKKGEAIGRTGPPTIGVSVSDVEEFHVLTVRAGRHPERDGEVAVDAVTARENDIAVGDRVTVLFEGPPEGFEVVGIVGFGDADNLAGATLAAFDLRTAQRVLGEEGTYDAISVRAEEGVSTAALRARIDAALPRGMEAVTAESVGEEQAQAIQEGLGFFRTALLVFGAVALFVGAFIIFNTFNILVTHRTKELALLRAIGASGGQVMRSVLAEATITGLVSSALGLGFGIVMAAGLQALLRGFGIALPSTALQVLPRTIIVAFVVGTGVTILASLMPGRRAARVAPMEALREGEGIRPLRVAPRALAGGALTALGIAGVLVGMLADTGGLPLVGVGILTTFLGVSLLSPLIARPLARVIGAPLPRIAGVPGRLGRNNAARNPRRTASTAAALMIGLALVGTFSIFGTSVKSSVSQIIADTMRADFILQPTSQFGAFSNSAASRLREDERIGAVSPIRYAEWREVGSDSSLFLSAVDPETFAEVMELEVGSGSIDALGVDEVMMHESVANAKAVGIGDTFDVRFPGSGGPTTLTVAGIYRLQSFVGDHIVSLETHARHYTTRLDSLVLVRAAPAVPQARARRAVEAASADIPNAEVLDQAGLRQEQEDQIDQLLALINALLGLAILIALLGIVNTLALSVFERTRELGLLRAIGLGRRQTRRMVRWESVIIALIGGVLGLSIGMVFGTILVRALADEGITELSIPGGQLLTFLVLAGVAGVLAAVGPARRAAKLNVLQAISYE